jgi:ribosomal protein S18 acetylase RimI-like enzyme
VRFFNTSPSEPEKTWREIMTADWNSFTMIDDSGVIAGFGQILELEPYRIHLGRIIISPEFRGKGLGAVLCRELMRVATEQFRPAEFTLNVYRSNTPALKLYKSVGFVMLAEYADNASIRMHLKN